MSVITSEFISNLNKVETVQGKVSFLLKTFPLEQKLTVNIDYFVGILQSFNSEKLNPRTVHRALRLEKAKVKMVIYSRFNEVRSLIKTGFFTLDDALETQFTESKVSNSSNLYLKERYTQWLKDVEQPYNKPSLVS